jgi:uncharacterized protein (TIGR02117 family)
MTSPPTPRWPRVKRWLCRAALLLAALLGIYAAFLLAGFIPINRGYRLPPADDRVRIFIRSNEIHTDVVMPAVHEGLGIDWRELFPPEHFDGDVGPAAYVAVGWGNRRFFVETPTWADLKIGSVIGALFWPSESVLHVEYLLRAAPGPHMREVFVSREQYGELVGFIRSSIGECDHDGCANGNRDDLRHYRPFLSRQRPVSLLQHVQPVDRPRSGPRRSPGRHLDAAQAAGPVLAADGCRRPLAGKCRGGRSGPADRTLALGIGAVAGDEGDAALAEAEVDGAGADDRAAHPEVFLPWLRQADADFASLGEEPLGREEGCAFGGLLRDVDRSRQQADAAAGQVAGLHGDDHVGGPFAVAFGGGHGRDHQRPVGIGEALVPAAVGEVVFAPLPPAFQDFKNLVGGGWLALGNVTDRGVGVALGHGRSAGEPLGR